MTRGSSAMRWGLALVLAAAAVPEPAFAASASGAERGQKAAAAAPVLPAGDAALSIPASQWAMDATANELAIIDHPGSYLRYRMHSVDEKGNQVRDIIECKEGTVARLILKDGRPLTAEEDRAEQDRLRAMLASPGNFARHSRSDRNSRKNGLDLVKLLPQAMLFRYAEGQPQSGTNAGRPEVVIDFSPNPAFAPPTLMAEALTGLMGRAWIDRRSRRLVRMDGTIFKGVNVGFGMLAHIYPGGKWTVEQAQVAANRWTLTRFTDQMAVRALMVKTMNVRTNLEASDFESMPKPLSYQEAIALLLATPLPEK